MNGDSNDQKLARLFAELRAADAGDLPAYGALIPATAAKPRPVSWWRLLPGRPLTRWTLAAAALSACTMLTLLRFAMEDSPAPGSLDVEHSSWWTSPTDSLLGETDSFGSLGTWQSPTDSLFDFSPSIPTT